MLHQGNISARVRNDRALCLLDVCSRGNMFRNKLIINTLGAIHDF